MFGCLLCLLLCPTHSWYFLPYPRSHISQAAPPAYHKPAALAPELPSKRCGQPSTPPFRSFRSLPPASSWHCLEQCQRQPTAVLCSCPVREDSPQSLELSLTVEKASTARSGTAQLTLMMGQCGEESKSCPPSHPAWVLEPNDTLSEHITSGVDLPTDLGPLDSFERGPGPSSAGDICGIWIAGSFPRPDPESTSSDGLLSSPGMYMPHWWQQRRLPWGNS